MDRDDFSVPETQPEETVLVEPQSPDYDFYANAKQSLLIEFAEVITEVAQLREKVEEGLDYLRQKADESQAYDRVKEEAFDRLYAEVEEVRQDRAFQQVRPLLIDLLLLYDRIAQGVEQVQGPDATRQDVLQLLQSLKDELLEVLYRREVEPIVPLSSTYDRTIQQAVSLQPAASESEHNQVVRVVRKGFRYRNRILRSEEVIVSNYKSN